MPLLFGTSGVLIIRMFQFYWTSPTKVRLRFLTALRAPLPATFQGNKRHHQPHTLHPWDPSDRQCGMWCDFGIGESRLLLGSSKETEKRQDTWYILYKKRNAGKNGIMRLHFASLATLKLRYIIALHAILITNSNSKK